MSDQLIITAGNNSFFEYLKNFVYSLRTRGEYKGKIVICDNTITGSWDNPGTYQEVASFSDKQVEFFDSFDVSVVLFHELLSRHGITRKEINQSRGYTARYPYKFIYNCLISKEYLGTADWICYFDADVYVQLPIQRIFDRLASGKARDEPRTKENITNFFYEALDRKN